MITAPIPVDEEQRIAALNAMRILDTPPEERFDRITKQALEALHVPISTISILDKDREWFKSCQGIQQREGKRSISFCGHALFSHDVFIVEDTTKDERFSDNPYVVGQPFVRFYAGMALYDQRTKLPMGVFCVKDLKPRSLSMEEIGTFLELAKQAEHELNTA